MSLRVAVSTTRRALWLAVKRVMSVMVLAGCGLGPESVSVLSS
jgi:hypothetical protein